MPTPSTSTTTAARSPSTLGSSCTTRPNYPNLVRLFDALDVPTEPSDMSFSVSVGDGRFEFRSRGAGLFAQPANVARPGMWRMLRDFRRFCREAPEILASGSRESLGSYLDRSGYSDEFRLDLLLPMTAAIWSTGLDDMLEFPVATLVRFLSNHSMLQVARGRSGGRFRAGAVSMCRG